MLLNQSITFVMPIYFTILNLMRVTLHPDKAMQGLSTACPQQTRMFPKSWQAVSEHPLPDSFLDNGWSPILQRHPRISSRDHNTPQREQLPCFHLTFILALKAAGFDPHTSHV